MFFVLRESTCHILIVGLLIAATGCSAIFKTDEALKGPWAHMYHSELSFSIDYPAHWVWSTPPQGNPESVRLESPGGQQGGRLTIRTIPTAQWWKQDASLESFIARNHPLLGPTQRRNLPTPKSHIITASLHTADEYFFFTLHPSPHRFAVLEFTCSAAGAQRLESVFNKMAKSFRFASE